MKVRTTLAVLLAVALAGCTQAGTVADPPAPAAVVAPVVVPTPSPSPSASVLAVVTHKPTPKPAPKPAVKPKPKVHHVAAKPRPTGWVCYVGKPCKVPPFSSPVWHKTVGCTVAWRKALHRTTCPPGWPPIP